MKKYEIEVDSNGNSAKIILKACDHSFLNEISRFMSLNGKMYLKKLGDKITFKVKEDK